MSLECSECERDLRGGHDKSCSRYNPPAAVNDAGMPGHMVDLTNPHNHGPELMCHGCRREGQLAERRAEVQRLREWAERCERNMNSLQGGLHTARLRLTSRIATIRDAMSDLEKTLPEHQQEHSGGKT